MLQRELKETDLLEAFVSFVALQSLFFLILALVLFCI